MNNAKGRKKFANALSYDWLKICAFTLIAVVFWVMVFSVISPRISLGQTFYLYSYGNIESPKSRELLKSAQRDGALSYDIRELVPMSIPIKDGSQKLTAYLGAGEGDIMVVDDDTFSFALTAYYDIDTMLKDAKSYCMKFSSSEEEFIPDTQKIREEFLKKKKKDKRFKTAKQKDEGVLLEQKRICGIYESADYVERVLAYCDENGIEIRKKAKIDENNENEEQKTYALCLNVLGGAFEYFYTRDDDGNLTADGLYIAVLDYRISQSDAQFETVGFLAYILRSFGNFPIEKQD